MSVRRTEEFLAPTGLPEGMEEDKRLTLAFQHGHKGAYQAIYERHSSRVQSVCRRMLGNHEDAQEATQETFLRVYQALIGFNGSYKLSAWITRIATNVCLDHLRARSRHPSEVGSLDVLELDPSDKDIASDPETIVIKNAEGKRIKHVLEALPPLHRAAIVLRDFEGLSYDEIGMVLAISDTQVKALLHRARRGFRRAWTTSRLPLLFPIRWWHRVRGLQETTREQALAQAGAPAGQAVSACAPFLQQCGQALTDRIAPVVTAVIVGTAAGAVAATSHSTNNDAAGTSEARAGSAEHGRHLAKKSGRRARNRRAARSQSAGPTAAELAATDAVPSPTPSGTPSPSTEPTTSSDAGQVPQDSPSGGSGAGPSQPKPLEAALGFDGHAVPAVAPQSNDTSASCSSGSVRQHLQAAFADGDRTYPATLSLDANSSLNLELTLSVDGYRVTYFGGGSLTNSSAPAETLTLSYGGNYSTTDPDARHASLPGSGGFRAGLTIDCSAGSLSSETLILSR